MIRQPKPGQRVRIHYATRAKRKGLAVPAEVMPWHGMAGVIVTANIRTKGPCNVTVRLDGGKIVVVPRGNLVREVDG